MNIATIIIGIDGWEQYTRPLCQSLNARCDDFVVIDNASREPYPSYQFVHRTERLCYSAAINTGKRILDEIGLFDWYIVLSNDVLCTAPFAHILESYSDDSVVGPLLKEVHGFPYIEGWCVCIPKRIWDAVGGWDENYQISSWEDVDLSTTAREKGFYLLEDTDLPFTHLDQRQRFTIVPNYWDSEAHNVRYFIDKHGVKA